MRLVARLILAAALSLTACGGITRAALRPEEILVFAAASLTESFREIGSGFRYTHPDIRVRFNFGPSDGLATGLAESGAADVFASASPRWMDAAARSPGVSDRAEFARNSLTVIVPPENPANIGTFRDLARPGLKLVLAATSVPAGGYAREALQRAGIAAAARNVVSNEEDVKGVVQKVVLGEADAGIVYRTDVTPAVSQRVRTIAIDQAHNVTASYQIAIVRRTRHPAAALAFITYVLGAGQEVLREAGFLPPA